MTRKPAPSLPSLALCVCLLFALTGCGGDASSSDGGSGDTSSEDTSGAISREDFIAQGNEICADYSAQIDASAADADLGTPDSIAAFVVDTILPLTRAAARDVQALGYPAGDEEVLDAIYLQQSAVLDQVEADPSISIGEDTGLFADVDQSFDDYGLTACGSESSSLF